MSKLISIFFCTMLIIAPKISLIAGTTAVRIVADTEVITGWQASDRINVWYDGKTYEYVVADAGYSSELRPCGEAIDSFDSSKPVAAYYNVSEVFADGSAKFNIPSEQMEGTASNFLPMYAYIPSAKLVDGCLTLTFKPLASVVEFRLQALSRGTFTVGKETVNANRADDVDYFLTKVVITPNPGIKGYTACVNATVNPATGEIKASESTTASLTYNFAEPSNIKGGRSIFLVVGKFEMNCTGATMDWYKGDILNYTVKIWDSTKIDFKSETANFYQPVTPKHFGLANYAAYYHCFHSLQKTQEDYINWCDDERNMILTGDIEMYGGKSGGNRIPSFYQPLTWNLDGRGHCFYNIDVTPYGPNASSYYFFRVVESDIRNLSFGKQDNEHNFVQVEGNCSEIAPILTQKLGTIKNCSNWISYNVTQNATDKHTSLGGIVAKSNGGKIEGCTNNGNLSMTLDNENPGTKNYKVGGILATNETKKVAIEGCTNNASIIVGGNISGMMRVAGIAGDVTAYGSTIANCVNNASVNCSTYATETASSQIFGAGICGNCQGGSISGCQNSGAVCSQMSGSAGKLVAAGIVASLTNNACVKDCEVRASVLSKKAFGMEDGVACWYAGYVSGIVGTGRVYQGITVNGTIVDKFNYIRHDIARRGADCSPFDITLITE